MISASETARVASSAELLSSIIYTSFDGFLSEISEVSYMRDDRAGELLRNLDVVFNDLLC